MNCVWPATGMAFTCDACCWPGFCCCGDIVCNWIPPCCGDWFGANTICWLWTCIFCIWGWPCIIPWAFRFPNDKFNGFFKMTKLIYKIQFNVYLLNWWWLLCWLLRLRLTSCDHYRLAVRLTNHILMLDILHICECHLQRNESLSIQIHFLKCVHFLWLTCWLEPGDCWINFCCIFCICCGDTF